MTLTLEQINASEVVMTAAKRSRRDVLDKLSKIGRAIYEMRNDRELSKFYHVIEYSRRSYENHNVYGEDRDHDWSDCGPVIELTFEVSYNGGGDYEYVSLPEAWIDQDWRALEQARLDKIKAEKEAEATSKAEVRPQFA